ncbi:hypothetical protein HDU98_007179 [Podochytrium sp. JEL0797]|nr:hypothetical protein HDU98_007179 [Podochytrium sp. JEL0797]
MGLLGLVCKLVGAQVALCEEQAFTPPSGLPPPSAALFKGLSIYLESFTDEDPSGRAINQISFGIPLVWHTLSCYVACTLVPCLLGLYFIVRGVDGESLWLTRNDNKKSSG